MRPSGSYTECPVWCGVHILQAFPIFDVLREVDSTLFMNVLTRVST
jgi:hypothetical protein